MVRSISCLRGLLFTVAIASLAACSTNGPDLSDGRLTGPDAPLGTADARVSSADATVDAQATSPDAANAGPDAANAGPDAVAAIDSSVGTPDARSSTPDAVAAGIDAQAAFCGDGIVNGNDVCDDGTNGDGICSADCQVSAFAGGDGSVGNPYQIANSDQLIAANNIVVADKSFQVTADIDLTGVTMEPIGFQNDSNIYSFTGTFDGGNHVISNWTYNSGSSCIGLISTNYGIVVDVILQSPTISGAETVAGISGCNGGLLARDHVLGGTITSGNNAGGLAGTSEGGSAVTAIANCENSATIIGDSVGGIVGNQGNGSQVIDSFSTGAVQSGHVGASLVGQQYSGTIYRSYASGLLTANGQYFGGLIAYDETPDSNDESYYDLSGTGQSTSVDGTGLDGVDMTTESSFVGWDFTNVWSIASGHSPVLRASGDVAPIAVPQQFSPQGEQPLPMDLAAFDLQGDTLTYDIVTPPTNGTLSSFDGSVVTYTSSTWSGGNDSFVYQAVDSLGLTSTPTTISVNTAAVCNNAEPGFGHGGDGSAGNPYVVSTPNELQLVHLYLVCNFVLGNDIDLSGIDFSPIGTSTTPFDATFDGNNHQIKNWTFSSDTNAHTGFFASTRFSATIKNLGITNESVTSTATYAAGLVADANGGSIFNVFTTGTVTGAADYTAGLVGVTSGTSIKRCHSDATVLSSSRAAGLVGYDYSGGTLSQSYATGNVTGSSAAGLVSDLEGVSIDRSYATGSVTATRGSAGGLLEEYIPDAGGQITNCFSSGAISNGAGDAGGIIATLFSQGNGTITNVYAVGHISSSSSHKGGLIGDPVGNFGTVVTNAFWDTTTTGVGTTAANAGTPETDDAMLMQSTYTGFDFTNVWIMGQSGYPQLR